jgi:HAE1 family hydrophobic/amphiphilic exporter-1
VGLTRLAIRRPVTMLMIILGLIIMGLVSYTFLPIQQLPNVSFPFAVVIVDFPGANPQDMYQTVTQPLENAISGVSGIQEMDGLSADGLSRIIIRFNLGVDVTTAANEVAQEVNRVQGQLPAGIQPPTILQANPNAFPIMNVAITGNMPRTQLYDLVSNVIQPDLQQVSGVGAVNVNSGIVPQVNVTVDPKLAESYGVSLQQITSAIASQNVSTPGGQTTVGGLTSAMRTQAYFQSARQLQDLVVATRPTGYITLAQVSDVQQGTAPVTMQAEFDGQPSIGLTLTSQSGANLVAVDRAVKAEMARLERSLPPGVSLHIVNDQTNYVYASMRAVEDDLVMAVLLPALVLLLFLHRPRNMLIVMLAIPTSLISTFILMYAFGFSLDLISLLALSLMTGILVDDSIVVLENINRHLSLGKNPVQAAIDGRSEIGQAAVAITLTDVVVYLPIAFTSGLVGQIFREFGLTIVVATLFSLFVSFTLTPLLAARWLKDPIDEAALAAGRGSRGVWDRFSAAFERGWARLRDRYGQLIRVALRRRPLVIGIGVCALAASVAFIPLGWVGTEFVPQDDYGLFNVNVQLPVGTALPITESVVDRLDQEIRALPGVVDTTLTAGAHGGFFGTSNTNTGQIFVDLKPVGQRPPLNWYLARVRALGRRFPGASVITFVPSALRIGGQRAVGVVLQGPDINVLDQQANRLTGVMQSLPGVVGVRNEAAQAQPEFDVQINRQMAAFLGVTAQTIGQTIQTAIAGTTASYLRPNGQTNETPIVVWVKGGDHLTAQQIEDLPLTVSSGSAGSQAPATYAQAQAQVSGSAPGAGAAGQGSSALITLGEVATVTPTFAPAELDDQNRQLEVTVDASTAGVPQGQVAQEITRAMASFGLPPGYTWSFSGAVQQQQQVFGPLFGAFALSVILVYMLTSALYESLLYPLAVLLSLPLATVGAFAGLAVTGNTLNLYSFMGLIMLMGLVAKNAILLVDYTNTLRRRGYSMVEALVESGKTRLRPILMTTATMVFSMLPLALKIGSGSEDRSPMATVLIGGLLTSTLLTLIFVPAMYTYLDGFGAWLARVGLARPQRFEPAEGMAADAPSGAVVPVGGAAED